MTCGSRLGFGDRKVLILHADDAGVDEYINTAIFQSLSQGFIQSCSVILNCGYPDKFLFKIRNYNYDVGLHFNPTSLDFSKQISFQFRYMAKKGVYPSHIDSHGGAVFSLPQLAETYINYSKQMNVPILVPNRKKETVRRFEMLGLNLSGFDNYQGLRIDDIHVLSMLGGESFEEKKTIFLNLLDNIQPGITQIVLHISSNLNWRKWYWEWELFEDEDVLTKLNSFVLTNWKEMWSRYVRTSA